MLRILKRLVLYSFLRLTLSITSLFSSKKEAAIAILLIGVIAGGFYISQDSKNKELLEQAGTGDAETVAQVVEEGAWLAATDSFGRTALHIAARYSNLETVHALLEMGANVNARDFRNRTPLHMTRYDGGANTQIVKLLLAYGSDPEARDYKNRTPMDILKGQARYNKPAEALLRNAIKKKQAAMEKAAAEAAKAEKLAAQKQKEQAVPPAPSSDTPLKTSGNASR